MLNENFAFHNLTLQRKHLQVGILWAVQEHWMSWYHSFPVNHFSLCLVQCSITTDFLSEWMSATSAAVYPWTEENIHSKLKGKTGVCSNEDQFTSGLRLWETTPSSPSSSQDLWKYNRPFIWQEEAWGKQKICFADRKCCLCTKLKQTQRYTLHKFCTSWQLYFKHKSLWEKN